MSQNIHRRWNPDESSYVIRNTSDHNRISDMHIWCEEHCQGNFNVEYYGKAPVVLQFESEQDAILFALTWE